MNTSVARYECGNRKEWDEFLDSAKNNHFMFKRDYMEYHSDRFVDYSLMFYDEKNHLIGLFPANIKNRALHSHQGLSFGGLLISRRETARKVLEIFVAMIEFLQRRGEIDTIFYKRTPDFYTEYPAQEDLYALFLLNADLYRRDISSVIDLSCEVSYTKGRKWSVNRAKKFEIVIQEVTEFENFWSLLERVLASYHLAKPTHSLNEITLLKKKFPEAIKCFTASIDNEIVSGTVIYETTFVAHTQYLANSEIGRSVGALDFLVDHLIKNIYNKKKYFDFGVSTESEGRVLNFGLISQKEGFGARGVVHDFYKIDLSTNRCHLTIAD
ncbi:GNAT family N-acetyltransferase [Gammaproteobacteria bacterium LSUCC0112]|nr:GNAT family N-acetyltransferase [Gammaproteobacteria bacterium LSUCC0112]